MALKFKKLTRSNMRKLEPGKQIIEHGIIFKRLSSNDGLFSINVMVDGQRIHRTIGKESENVTRQQAEEVIAKFKTDARAGRLSLPKGRKTVLSFIEASDKYLKRLKDGGESPRHIAVKKGQFKNHLIPFFKKIPLDKISEFDITRYKKHCKEKEGNPLQDGAVNVTLATLTHLLNKGVEWEWIKPFAMKIKKFKAPPGRTVYLTQPQIVRVLDTAKKDACDYIHLFIKIGLDTSMRKMEILSIKLENIEPDKLRIKITDAKAGGRNQPMPKELAEVLQAEIDNAEEGQIYLFPSPKSSTGHIVKIEVPFHRVITNAGLNPAKVIPHTLRHTAITHLIRTGTPLPDCLPITGHSTITMLLRYFQDCDEAIDTAMQKLTASYNPPLPEKIRAVN